MAAKKKDTYAECRQIKRTKPDAKVTEEISKEIGSNYRTLPAFEKGLFDHIYLKHYSLQRNEFLLCRWKEYKKHIQERVFAPFQFLNIRDLHFYNASIRLAPSESTYQYPEHRMKLRSGPGVDIRGQQLPIPQEMLLKRGKIEKQDGGKIKNQKNVGKKKRESKK